MINWKTDLLNHKKGPGIPMSIDNRSYEISTLSYAYLLRKYFVIEATISLILFSAKNA